MIEMTTLGTSENAESADEYARSALFTQAKSTEHIHKNLSHPIQTPCESTNALITSKFNEYTRPEQKLITTLFTNAVQGICKNESITNCISSSVIPKSLVIFNIMSIAASDNQPMSALLLENMLMNELIFADVHPTLPSYVSKMVYDDMLTLMDIGKNYHKQNVAKSIGQLAFQLQASAEKTFPHHIVNSAFSRTLLESLGFIYKEFGVWQLTDLGGHFLVSCSPKQQISDGIC
jgi:hypothetical protein